MTGEQKPIPTREEQRQQLRDGIKGRVDRIDVSSETELAELRAIHLSLKAAQAKLVVDYALKQQTVSTSGATKRYEEIEAKWLRDLADLDQATGTLSSQVGVDRAAEIKDALSDQIVESQQWIRGVSDVARLKIESAGRVVGETIETE